MWTALDPDKTIFDWYDVALCPDGTVLTVGTLYPSDRNLVVHKYAP